MWIFMTLSQRKKVTVLYWLNEPLPPSLCECSVWAEIGADSPDNMILLYQLLTCVWRWDQWRKRKHNEGTKGWAHDLVMLVCVCTCMHRLGGRRMSAYCCWNSIVLISKEKCVCVCLKTCAGMHVCVRQWVVYAFLLLHSAQHWRKEGINWKQERKQTSGWQTTQICETAKVSLHVSLFKVMLFATDQCLRSLGAIYIIFKSIQSCAKLLDGRSVVDSMTIHICFVTLFVKGEKQKIQ